MNWSRGFRSQSWQNSGGRCVYPGSVFDPISARIAADIGFEVGMFAGSTASLTVLGAPDLIVLTLTEFAQQAYSHQPRRRAAADGRCRPRLWQRAQCPPHRGGARDCRGCGMTIEDTVLPTPFGEVGQTRLVSLAEGIGKMKAALAAGRIRHW